MRTAATAGFSVGRFGFDQQLLNVAVNTGGEIAWAFRKESPELEGIVNEFVKGNRKGTLMGNILFKRYLQQNTWAPLPYVDEHSAELLFRHKVMRLLQGEGLLSEERSELLLSWRHTGFSVHNRVRVETEDQP